MRIKKMMSRFAPHFNSRSRRHVIQGNRVMVTTKTEEASHEKLFAAPTIHMHAYTTSV